MNLSDTICAISTPPGEGGISVIRISGDKSFRLTEKIFFKDNKRKKLICIADELSHTIHFGYLFDNKKLIDEVLISIFKNPNSYTGEDVIEISSHGGAFLSAKILDLILKNGARHSEPGEFTKRAFIYGKIDLSQAEAVADLIKSKTDSAHLSSVRQLDGSLKEFVNAARKEIINITSLIELELDFAEEGLEFVKKEEINNLIVNLHNKLERIILTYLTGKIIREGVNLVIAGKPNSGKSSLFNYFLKTNRSIVSTIAGTTRDYIEENIIIKGIVFNLIDTAGLRISSDEIESEGISRSYEKISQADMIIYLIDSSENETLISEDQKYFRDNFDSKKSISVFSKCDLADKKLVDDVIKISLLKDVTIELLEIEMINKIFGKNIKPSGEEIIITNLRHKICLENVVVSLKNAVKTIEDGMSGEFISVDLRNALKHLGEITGEVTNDEILNNIFRNFCIGK